jgi:hypothetical protein
VRRCPHHRHSCSRPHQSQRTRTSGSFPLISLSPRNNQPSGPCAGGERYEDHDAPPLSAGSGADARPARAGAVPLPYPTSALSSIGLEWAQQPHLRADLPTLRGGVHRLSSTSATPTRRDQAKLSSWVSGDGGAPVALLDRIAAFATKQGAHITRKDCHPIKGYFTPDTKEICVGTRLSQTHALKTLIHETAHLLSSEQQDLMRADKETLAESSAFVVLSHFGIDSSEYSFPYVARWAQDKAVLKRNLELIQTTAHTIISGISPDEAHQTEEPAISTTADATLVAVDPPICQPSEPPPPPVPPAQAIDPALFPTGKEVQFPLLWSSSAIRPQPSRLAPERMIPR